MEGRTPDRQMTQRLAKHAGRVMSSAQTALAEATETFGRIDILLCNSSEGIVYMPPGPETSSHPPAVVGTVEELSTSPATIDLVRRQFEVIFFGQVNFIRAILPLLRAKHNGHIIVLSGITGHMGTPGISMYCASTWALEGFCDSLAYEIAPFNIKLTIVQPNKEISLLTNNIIFAPPLPQYESHSNPAPGLRDILGRVVHHSRTRIGEAATPTNEEQPKQSAIVTRFPRLPSESNDRLTQETVHALAAIGGHVRMCPTSQLLLLTLARKTPQVRTAIFS
jgi:NAD(P)-dependent dehydrogenase (short-subunit alcohol dehydrogenase family)